MCQPSETGGNEKFWSQIWIQQAQTPSENELQKYPMQRNNIYA